MEVKLTDWAAPTETTSKYEAKCKAFVEDDSLFDNFKRDEDYNKILEGNERVVGQIALDAIDRTDGFETLMNRLNDLKENETIGNPRLENYAGVGEIAPSTLRYFNTYLEIQSLLRDFKPKTFVEIGGGYGGLYKTLDLFYDIESYSNIDLTASVALSEKYLSKFDLKLSPIPESFDVFIADSSLAECDVPTQERYLELARRAKFVYIVYNTLHTEAGRNGIELIESMMPEKEFSAENTRNELGRFVQGIIVIYGKNR